MRIWQFPIVAIVISVNYKTCDLQQGNMELWEDNDMSDML